MRARHKILEPGVNTPRLLCLDCGKVLTKAQYAASDGTKYHASRCNTPLVTVRVTVEVIG